MPLYRLCPICDEAVPEGESCCTRKRQPTASDSFYNSARWRKLSASCIRRDGECALRGTDCVGRVIAHHRIPRRDGGPDTLDNLIALCHGHHQKVESDIKAGRNTLERWLAHS